MKRSPIRRKTPLKRHLKQRRKRVGRESVQFLKKRLDNVFSQFIRLRDKGVCFTCGIVKSWREQQNGHYISRGFNSLRFDERNCNCQCVSCNVFRHGNMDVYALKLTEKYGADILKELSNEKRKIKQFTAEELKKLINQYEEKVAELLK